MKNELEVIDAALSTIVDQPPRPKLSPRMIWLRGLALERQRAARRSLRITRLLSAATLMLVLVAGAVLASTSAITVVADHTAAAASAVFILGYTALQLMRSSR
ncbi:MAG TPA: hypothetical protein VGD49_14920 [Longimicrobiales bacterium]